MFSTEDGGRQTSIFTGYRPNHAFVKIDNPSFQTYIGEVQFDDKKEIRPGESGDVTVYFLIMGAIELFLTTGRIWWIYEGGRLVGQGDVKAVKQQPR